MKYTGTHTAQISFPLGGIGTGCIGLGGNGGLVDIEIKNRPNKHTSAEFTHFAIKAEDEHGVVDARILQGDLEKDFIGCTERALYTGYGFGPDRGTMAGFPHFESCIFQGEFPIAELDFKHHKFPGEVKMTAFNPLIPTNENDSSIPAAFFKFQIKNTSLKKLSYTLALSCNNYYCRTETVHTYEEQNDVKMIFLSNTGEKKSAAYGDLTIATNCSYISHQEYWFRGRWFDNSSVFWQEFTKPGKLPNRVYETTRCNPDSNETSDVATLAAHFTLAPGESEEILFVLSWSNPYMNNHWEITHIGLSEEEIQKRRSILWKNYYATLFSDSRASAVYSLENFDRLYKHTLLYKQAIYASSLPDVIKDAVTANIAVLKSPTCLRLNDGSFYAFEGVHEHMGSCEGTCTHVWSYAYALAFLFPKLERSARTNEYMYSMQEDGGMGFRLQLPLGVGPTNHRPAADGQFGTILRVYREFLISGDMIWLKKIWPQVKQSLMFAWSEKNTDCWDSKQEGILSGRQHHTLDMELFGPNSWLSSMYLSALQAGARLAHILGEEDTSELFLRIFENGKSKLNKTLYNGEYFFQNIELSDKSILEKYNNGFSMHGASAVNSYWNEEKEEIKYQIGEGCSIDQILGQWHADLLHLDNICDPDKTVSALQSVFKYNFISNMREHANPCRVYSMNQEQGTIICSYPPNRKKPFIPIPYSEETMHGFEYQSASHMILHGLENEGLSCVKAVRDHYDGYKRNPWNELECGSNYARSLSSYALLLVYSGFVYDMYRKRIGFHPIHNDSYVFFWSLDSGFGLIKKQNYNICLEVLYGTLPLRELEIETDGITEFQHQETPFPFSIENHAICLKETIVLTPNQPVNILYSSNAE